MGKKVDAHVRGRVTEINLPIVATHTAHPMKEVHVRLIDEADGQETYVWWKSWHFLNDIKVEYLDIQPGDEIEVFLESSGGWPTKDSFIQNYSRGLRYTLVRLSGGGCLVPIMLVVALLAFLLLLSTST